MVRTALLGLAAVAAAGRVTIGAQPPAAPDGTAGVTLSGYVAGVGEGQEVRVEGRACGTSFYLRVGRVRTVGDGSWTLGVRPPVTTRYRAKSGTETSRTILVEAGPAINLVQGDRRGRLQVTVNANDPVVGKRLVLQKLGRTGWARVRSIVIRKEPGSRTRSTFTVAAGVPRGTIVRLALSSHQMGACYLTGYSDAMRV